MSTNKRASAVPPALKPPTSLHLGATISDSASLTGTQLITVGSDSVVHPRAKITSAHGPVTIGSTCILSERSLLGLLSTSSNQPEGVTIEDGVIIELGAVVEARRVGEGSVIEVNAKVGKGAAIGKHCKIGPLCSVAEGEVVPDYTVIYGTGMRRFDNSGVEDLKMKMVRRQTDVLKKLIPSNLSKFM